jgi:hypothetical protein
MLGEAMEKIMGMVGRRAKSPWGEQGEVIKWEPLGAAMCDVLLQQDDGKKVWHASTDLRPIDNLGPLPSRREACKFAEDRTLRQLRAIRAQHVKELRTTNWPGAEFGKALVGQAIDNAIEELEGNPDE